MRRIGLKKKGQATHITPLRPATLAAFLPWGSSPGAGCTRLALSGKSTVVGLIGKPRNELIVVHFKKEKHSGDKPLTESHNLYFRPMKKRFTAIACFILSGYALFSQTLTISTDTVNLGVVFENQADSAVVYVKNAGPHWSLFKIESHKSFPFYGDTVVSARYASQTVGQGDSLPVWIIAKPIHNLRHKGVILLNDAYGCELRIPYKFQGRYSKSYYFATENKEEAALRSQLNTIISTGFTSLSYNNARDEMYADLDNVGGTVTCVYTGRTASFTTRSGANSNSFNCEHTFPQGFFNENLPMKSDIHHLFPTDVAANSERGNLPFGVVSNPSWQVGGSKKNASTFEPRNVHKGTVARAMMYFVLRYQDYNNFFAPQEAILRQWHSQYPPSTSDRNRNDGIYQLQNNRNPFVDYPQFAARITNLVGTTSAPAQPGLYVVDTVQLPYDSTVSSLVTYALHVVNYGNTTVSLSNFQLSTSGLSFANATGANAVLAPRQSLKIEVDFQPGTNYNGQTLTFSANAGNPSQRTVYFKNGSFVFFDVTEFEQTLGIRITQQEITWHIVKALGQMQVLDMQGRILKRCAIEEGGLAISDLPAGVYILNATSNAQSFSQKFVITR